MKIIQSVVVGLAFVVGGCVRTGTGRTSASAGGAGESATRTGASEERADATPATSDETAIRAMIDRRRLTIEAFFGEGLPKDFAVRVFSNRAEMARFAAEKWNTPQLPCWAVAMGTGSTMVVLGPSVWKTEACEHDPSDVTATEKIIAHELVHVFHGQHRDDPEFNKADDAGWFVEGLAVFASGQLDESRLRQAGQVVSSGKSPAHLSEAWSGNARYAVAGTMVRLVDQRVGRERLRTLLPASTTAEVLTALGMSEAEFLERWRASVAP